MSIIDFFDIGQTYELTLMTDLRKTWGVTSYQLFWRANKAGKPRRVALVLQGTIEKPFVWLNGCKGTFTLTEDELLLSVPHGKNIEHYVVSEINEHKVPDLISQDRSEKIL